MQLSTACGSAMKTLDRLNGRFPFGLDREIHGWNDHVPGGKHRRRRRYILVTLVPDTFVLHRQIRNEASARLQGSVCLTRSMGGQAPAAQGRTCSRTNRAPQPVLALKRLPADPPLRGVLPPPVD